MSEIENSGGKLESHLRRHGHLWLAALCVSAFLLTYLAPVDASSSDPWGTLLTSQAMIEHGTIRLDAYFGDVRWEYRRVPPAANGHVYNYFPVGTSILALPAVVLARLRGQDMIYPEDNRALQNSLSSLTVVAAALLTWALCRRFLPRSASLAVSAAFVFGSSIASTLGSALWSINLALVLGLACALLVATSPPRRLGRGAELMLGVLVFTAYLCRPTMALLMPLLAAYLWAVGRRFPGVFIATVAALSALFVLLSWRESGTWLPPYYQPGRLGTQRFSQALVGHLLSPSRGLLVGSPFLLLPIAGLAIWPARLARDLWVRLALAWIGLHWIVISLFHNWWGGWSFGSRLFADALPAFLLLTVRVAAVARARLPAVGRRVAGATFLVFAACAAFIHSHQGLYNVYAMLWNDGIDQSGPARVFDWRYPQFLASPRSLGAHAREHVLLASQAVEAGEALLPGSDKAVFEGWWSPEGEGAWRWSKSRQARVLFKAARSLGEARRLMLEIEAGTYQPQSVEVRLSGVVVGTMRSVRDFEPAVYRFEVPAEARARAREPLPGVVLFELELEIPGAVLVDEGPHSRRLGVCLRRLTFSVL